MSTALHAVDDGADRGEPRISYLIKRVEQGSRSLIDDQLDTFGITLNQYTALSVLRMRAGLSSAELSRRSFVTPQAMNQLVGILEGRRLLAREADPRHRRILRAYLTPAGHRLLAQCDAVIDEAEQAMLRDLTAAERRGLAPALAGSSVAVNRMDPPRGGGGGQVRRPD